MALVSRVPRDNRFVTYTDWKGYLAFLKAVGDRPIHITYDRGALEIMTPSQKHERSRALLGALLECLMEEQQIEFMPGGSMTFKRRDLQRGLEPDECYWIARWREVAGLEEYDAQRDPPPDLVLEVEVSRRSLDRIEMYRVMGVPEVWRYRRDETLQVYRLTEAGTWQILDHSPTFPRVPLEQILRHVRSLGPDCGMAGVIRAFRQWVRDHR